MENNNFIEYKFENYDVKGLKLEINFSKNDSIKIRAHEEINIPIENNIEDSFEPLLLGIDMNLEIIKNINDLKGKNLLLLDGHHRYEYLNRNNIDKSIEIILISTDDVEILSYPSYLIIEQREFREILENNNFSNKITSKFFVSLNDNKFFNNEIEDIYELYAFKNLCLTSGYISPANNENEPKDKTIIHFTPIEVSEILDRDMLFPPKSTWITPRL